MTPLVGITLAVVVGALVPIAIGVSVALHKQTRRVAALEKQNANQAEKLIEWSGTLARYAAEDVRRAEEDAAAAAAAEELKQHVLSSILENAEQSLRQAVQQGEDPMLVGAHILKVARESNFPDEFGDPISTVVREIIAATEEGSGE